MIIVVCFISAILYDLDWIRLALSGVLLVAGCFFHYMTKGVLIRNVVFARRGHTALCGIPIIWRII